MVSTPGWRQPAGGAEESAPPVSFLVEQPLSHWSRAQLDARVRTQRRGLRSALCRLLSVAVPIAGTTAMAIVLVYRHESVAAPSLVDFAIADTFPHQAECFTEGLFLQGHAEVEVYESCGLWGQSYLRRYAPRTNRTIQIATVPKEFFSEGVSVLGGSLYMLTYRHHIVVEYDAATLREVRRHKFAHGEGWGMTTDGCDLLCTTGSEYIYRLRPDSAGVLQFISKVKVTMKGKPVFNLNEVEYVTPKLWVNQWKTNRIFRVDLVTGVVEKQLDIGSLHRWRGMATPNGIAYSTALGENLLLVTGKLWPSMFALELSTSDLCGHDVQATSQEACASAPASACWPSSGGSPGIAADGPEISDSEEEEARAQSIIVVTTTPREASGAVTSDSWTELLVIVLAFACTAARLVQTRHGEEETEPTRVRADGLPA